MKIFYKTRICRYWADDGHCSIGPNCEYAHGKKELRPIQFNENYSNKNQHTKDHNISSKRKYDDRDIHRDDFYIHNNDKYNDGASNLHDHSKPSKTSRFYQVFTRQHPQHDKKKFIHTDRDDESSQYSDVSPISSHDHSPGFESLEALPEHKIKKLLKDSQVEEGELKNEDEDEAQEMKDENKEEGKDLNGEQNLKNEGELNQEENDLNFEDHHKNQLQPSLESHPLVKEGESCKNCIASSKSHDEVLKENDILRIQLKTLYKRYNEKENTKAKFNNSIHNLKLFLIDRKL